MANQLLSYHNWWSCFLKGLLHLPNLFFSSTHFLSSAARCFWTCTMYKKKIQEGGEEKKDHSEGIWLGLIWKYCFTSSEPNYWSELVVLSKSAHSHCSPDGQGVVWKSVTVTTVCTWTPGFSTALLLCSRSEALLCYLWTWFFLPRDIVSREARHFLLLPPLLCLSCLHVLGKLRRKQKGYMLMPKNQHKLSNYLDAVGYRRLWILKLEWRCLGLYCG